MKNKFLKYFVISFAWLMLCSSAVFAASQGPVDLLQSLANRMISELKSHKATLRSNPSLVYSIANRIIVPHADLDAMSQRVLPAKTWEAATPEQRRKFEREFTTVLERTYASALAEYTDETVKFFPLRSGAEGKSYVTVNSQIVRTDGPSIAVNYTLVLRGSQWRLLDITVEGVSMLESFRSQFSDSLSRGDINNLIDEISNHNSNHDGHH